MNTKEILDQLTLEEKAALCSGRDFWKTKAIERLGIESVMMCDGPHGLRKQEGEGDHLGINESIPTVCYPSASALASSFDRDVMKKLGKALGRECQAEHVGMLLGPGMNIKRSPLCGRNFEYFSEDPLVAGEMGAAYIQALQSEGVAACVKHFACNNQETMRMAGSSQVDERTLHEIYLPAFETAVKKGKTRGIMAAYNAVNGEFCSENKTLLTDILRDEWGYDGMVVTDWGAVKNRAVGVAAGLDLEMPGGPTATGEELVKAVKEGTLSEEALDRAAGSVLQFILTAMQNQRDEMIDREACRNLSEELSAECAVLLKNDGALPLSESSRVAFIGEFAKMPRYQGGGSSHINVPHAVGAVEAAEEKDVIYTRGYDVHSETSDPALVEEAIEAARSAQAAVIFAGLPDAYETEGADREHMRIPENQNELIKAVAAVNPKTIVVLHGGSVMELPWLDKVSAVLLMHLGGEQVGKAAVELLYGEKNPSGHLAETWPARLEDNPSYLNFPGEEGVVTYAEGIYVGYRYYDKKKMTVTFPFGHGLSYTTFTYENLQVDKESLTDQESLTVRVDVKNTGKYAGKAVVQLYVSDRESTVRRPIRELRDFAKVALEPGEVKTVSFTLDKRAFAYYEPKCSDWFVESGEFEIGIGDSSRNIVLSQTVRVEGTTLLSFTITETTTIGQLMKHPKGSLFVRQMMGSSAMASSDMSSSMGEGTEKALQKMVLEIPIGAMVSYGRMTAEQLKALIDSLNS
ncbi:MAG: glycoside hydrolase family 3 C-terminal domain-containing protein [Firmicutes bacterium]|nr:glycoside hydrolase family 3 C-terminal domain-containing protein [Bacillota bacterium]